MESRQERHGKSKKDSNPSKKPSLKVLGGFTVAAVACFAIGIGASYWTSNYNNGEEDGAASTPMAIISPKPTPSSSNGNTAVQVSPKASPVVTSTPTPSANATTVKQEGTGAQVKLTFVGDVLMASKVEDILKQKGYDYPYTNVKDFLTKH